MYGVLGVQASLTDVGQCILCSHELHSVQPGRNFCLAIPYGSGDTQVRLGSDPRCPFL